MPYAPLAPPHPLHRTIKLGFDDKLLPRHLLARLLDVVAGQRHLRAHNAAQPDGLQGEYRGRESGAEAKAELQPTRVKTLLPTFLHTRTQTHRLVTAIWVDHLVENVLDVHATHVVVCRSVLVPQVEQRILSAVDLQQQQAFRRAEKAVSTGLGSQVAGNRHEPSQVAAVLAGTLPVAHPQSLAIPHPH